MLLFRLIKRLIKALVFLVVIVVLIPIAGLAYGFLTTSAIDTAPLAFIAEGAPPAALAMQIRAAIPGYERPEESTWLPIPNGRSSMRRANMPASSGSAAERLSLLVHYRPLLAGLRDGDPRQLCPSNSISRTIRCSPSSAPAIRSSTRSSGPTRTPSAGSPRRRPAAAPPSTTTRPGSPPTTPPSSTRCRGTSFPTPKSAPG